MRRLVLGEAGTVRVRRPFRCIQCISTKRSPSSADASRSRPVYIGNNMEVIGLSVGGSLTTAARRMSILVRHMRWESRSLPTTAPASPNSSGLKAPKHTDLLTVAQRSIDPKGGPAEAERNHSGFRFIPHGEEPPGETGYQRIASATAHDIWFRAGYLHNSTPFTNLTTRAAQSGQSLRVCSDGLLKSNSLQPVKASIWRHSHGPPLWRFYGYDNDHQLRLYQKAPFRSRPFDMASAVSLCTRDTAEN